MSTSDRYQRLQRLFDPRSIAFVGGSALEPAISYTRALGFDGDYHVINPRRDEVGGIACVTSATQIARAPDVAVGVRRARKPHRAARLPNEPMGRG